MLIEFRTANFLSFKDMVEFSMLASNDKTHEDDNTFPVNNRRILKSAAVYGANGSGKTNFVRAIGFMRDLVLGESPIRNCAYKLDRTMKDEPSFFEIIFIKDNIRYRYGFEIDRKSVLSEWLFYVPTTREASLFTREKQNITISRSFREGKVLSDSIKKDKLFLPFVAQLNGASITQSIMEWFKNVSVMSGLDSDLSNTTDMLLEEGKSGKKRKKQVLDILNRFDAQIEDIAIEERYFVPIAIPADLEISDQARAFIASVNTLFEKEGGGKKMPPRVIIYRKTYENGKESGIEEFDLRQQESDGTKKLFALAGSLVQSLETGKTIVVDELESKLHPLVTKEIVKLFNSKISNKKNAQLIFTTHDTNLLQGNHFRRDQIWFTEKDKYGSSHLYSLLEYKPRKDASFQKDYINGRYGAIPYIGDFNSL
jgi:uncharacterized protein